MNLKDIQQAIKDKQKGLNADITTLIKISKENRDLLNSIKIEQDKKEIEYKKLLNKLEVKQL